MRGSESLSDVDAYIAAAPKAAQPRLRQLRKLIRAAAPRAQERLSYGIPFYEYRGRLIYFAAHKTHIGMYPAGDAIGLETYLTEKATLRFPHDEPLPVELIRKLIVERVKERDAATASQTVGGARRPAKKR